LAAATAVAAITPERADGAGKEFFAPSQCGGCVITGVPQADRWVLL